MKATQLYNKYALKEAFDFSGCNYDEEDDVAEIMDIPEVKTQLLKNTPIEKVLAMMGIPKPSKTLEITDSEGLPAMIYCSKNKTIISRDYFGMLSPQAPAPINKLVMMLKNDKGWKRISSDDECPWCDIYERYSISGPNGEFAGRVNEVFVSSDNGIYLILYKPQSILFNGVAYDFGWSMQYTKEVGYDYGNVKKPKRVKRNYKGMPIQAPSADEAIESYNDYSETIIAINACESDYWDAFRKEYEYLEGKYNIRKKSYDHPDHKLYDQEQDEWEKQAKHDYKLDRDEYKDLVAHEKELKQRLKDTLTIEEVSKIKKQLPMKEIYRKKWCSKCPIFDWYPVWKRYYAWFKTVK